MPKVRRTQDTSQYNNYGSQILFVITFLYLVKFNKETALFLLKAFTVTIYSHLVDIKAKATHLIIVDLRVVLCVIIIYQGTLHILFKVLCSFYV